MIERILPAVVSSAEAFSDPPDSMVFPAEEALLARAVERRRREFATARACARSALAALGVRPGADPARATAAPRSGRRASSAASPTAPGYRAAAVARASDVLDASGWTPSRTAPLPDGVLEPGVAARRAGPAAPNSRHAAPGVLLGPAAVQRQGVGLQGLVPARPGAGSASRRPTSPSIRPTGTFTRAAAGRGPGGRGRPVTGFSGRWLAGDGLVLTTVVLGGGG